MYICFYHPQFMRLSRPTHLVVPWQINSILIMDTKLPSMPKYAELLRVCPFHLFTEKRT